MNKELEKAITRLKILIKDDCNCEECIKDKKAYSTVLNYIGNSIPKEVIKNKIEQYKKEGYMYENRVCTMYYKREDEIDALQELLESEE